MTTEESKRLGSMRAERAKLHTGAVADRAGRSIREVILNRPNLSGTITLEFTWTQLRCVELGVSAFLRELAERPATALGRQQRAELTALRAQIDKILMARVAELRAYDEEHQRQGQNTT